jgi:ATP-dependent RNA helicase DDX55/SPB4
VRKEKKQKKKEFLKRQVEEEKESQKRKLEEDKEDQDDWAELAREEKMAKKVKKGRMDKKAFNDMLMDDDDL